MLTELNPNHVHKIGSLLAQLVDRHVPAGDLLDGTRPGKVYVDDVDDPKSVFMYSGAWYYLAGEPTNAAFNQAVHEHIMHPEFEQAPFRGLPQEVFLDVHPDSWRDQFPTIFGEREPITVARRHYLFGELPSGWRAGLPEGYSIRQLDETLLADEMLQNRDDVKRWIQQTWTGHTENFPKRGTGAVIVHDDAIACWCLAVAVAGEKVELGIETHYTQRRKGLAALTAMAAVEFCQQDGFEVIDWHCDAINFGSWKTAEKAGFILDREYTSYLYFFDPIVHFGVTGNYALVSKDYQSAVGWYKKAFAINPDPPSWLCFMAARAYAAVGRDQEAVASLNMAIDKGWLYAESLDDSEEFESLRQTPEWRGILEQLREKQHPPQTFDIGDDMGGLDHLDDEE